MTTLELIAYYANLLILQYNQKERASAMIKALVTPVVMPQVSEQVVGFDVAPTSGVFVLSYDSISSASINWNDSTATIQSKLRAITGLTTILVEGSIASLNLTVTFVGVTAPALLLELVSSTLAASGDDALVTISETDLTLPLAVQDGFNLSGTELAEGAQLDVLGKYVGVSRTGPGFFGQVILDDADYRVLIQMAIIKNSAGSSLSIIQDFIHTFFPGQMLVFDNQLMQLNYMISTAVGSPELVQLFVTEGLLPKPMAVQVALIIYAPVIDMFFGFRTYQLPGFNVTPFNTYADYQTDWPWLSYSDALII